MHRCTPFSNMRRPSGCVLRRWQPLALNPRAARRFDGPKEWMHMYCMDVCVYALLVSSNIRRIRDGKEARCRNESAPAIAWPLPWLLSCMSGTGISEWMDGWIDRCIWKAAAFPTPLYVYVLFWYSMNMCVSTSCASLHLVLERPLLRSSRLGINMWGYNVEDDCQSRALRMGERASDWLLAYLLALLLQGRPQLMRQKLCGGGWVPAAAAAVAARNASVCQGQARQRT